MGLTQQFALCGNAFRLDSWSGCSYGCRYCFVTQKGRGERQAGMGDVSVLWRALEVAFEEDRQRVGLNTELLRRRVPLHFGGVSDPSQPEALATSREFLRALEMYAYPVMVATKGVGLLPAARERKRVAFQVSLSTLDPDLAARLEPGAPSPRERLSYVRELKARGFWVAVRIQPLLTLEDALRVMDATADHVDYFLMEHLGIPRRALTHRVARYIAETLGIDLGALDKGRVYWEYPQSERRANVLALRAHCPIDLGVGDNDLQMLSTSVNCCGLDTAPKAFDNWMRYNQLYIQATGDRDVWYPKSSVKRVMMSHQRSKALVTVKDYTDRYLGG
jgi:DNA repair photolyase